MTVGTDTYIVLDDADTYISTHYISTDAGRVAWEDLDDDDKEALLLAACLEIECLPFIGRKMFLNQALAFPRYPSEEVIPDYPYLDFSTGTIPQKVINAQCELALWLLSNSSKLTDAENRANLQAQGVKSFSIGDLSENYAAGASAVPVPLLCPKCRTLLKAYTEGSFPTC